MSQRYYKIKLEPKKGNAFWLKVITWVLNKFYSRTFNKSLTYMSHFTESNKSGVAVDLDFATMKVETYMERVYMFPMKTYGFQPGDEKILQNSAGIRRAWVRDVMMVVELETETTESTLISAITAKVRDNTDEKG